MPSKLEVVNHICSMLCLAVKDRDKDAIRSNLTDLQDFIVQQKLLGD